MSKVFYIAGTELAIEVAGTELSTNMSMIGSVAGITKCVSMGSLDRRLTGTVREEVRRLWRNRLLG